jgi:outer membrane protein assembly factor BamB
MNRRSLCLLLLLFVASTASAQMRGGGFNPFGMVMGDGMDLTVASDGTVFVTRNVQGGGVDLAAINPNGTDRWTFRLQMPMTVIALNDTTVLIGWADFGNMMQNNPQKMHLFALSLTDGKQLGKLDVDGLIMRVTGYKSGFYAEQFVTDGTSNRPSLTRLSRKLIALDNNGNKIWDKTLE